MEKNLSNLVQQKDYLLYEEIKESDKLIKYFISLIMLLGAMGFLIVGVSSYLKFNLISILQSEEIIFFPQGVTMCFYGSLGTILSLFQLKTLASNIGEGYNEFNKETGKLRIFRKGSKGKESNIDIIYSLNDIVRLITMINFQLSIKLKNKRLKQNISFL